MQVEFHRTGERRYGIVILREGLPPLEMNPAPGFDELMPHDLQHFLVEQELGLKNAIFGQVARGGTAGTFTTHPSEDSNNRQDSRLRRKEAQRGKKLLKIGADECAQSERATYICLYDWLANSADEKLRERAKDMKINADGVFAKMSDTERAKLNKKKLAEIRNRMDELSKKWSALSINESMKLDWLRS